CNEDAAHTCDVSRRRGGADSRTRGRLWAALARREGADDVVRARAGGTGTSAWRGDDRSSTPTTHRRQNCARSSDQHVAAPPPGRRRAVRRNAADRRESEARRVDSRSLRELHGSVCQKRPAAVHDLQPRSPRYRERVSPRTENTSPTPTVS